MIHKHRKLTTIMVTVLLLAVAATPAAARTYTDPCCCVCVPPSYIPCPPDGGNPDGELPDSDLPQQPETPVTPAQQTGSTAATRPSATGASTTRSYTVVSGDTMWGICRKFYGDGSLAWRLAAANGVANANLIYPGQTLTIPPKDNLPAAAAKPVSAQIAEATTAVEEKDGSGNTVKITPWVPESTVRNLTQNALETIQTGGSALPWLTTNSSW